MNKQKFLAELQKGLSGLPKYDIEERLTFYSEMIEDRMEEGLSEEEAVSAIGSTDEIVRQTVADTPLSKIAKERIRSNRHLKVWEIVLLSLGSPIWLSLGIAAAAVILSLYVSIWAVIISLWAVFASFVLSAVSGIPGCIIFALRGSFMSALTVLSAGITCAGLSVLMFFGCKQITKGFLLLTKKISLWIKNCFIKKEEA